MQTWYRKQSCCRSKLGHEHDTIGLEMVTLTHTSIQFIYIVVALKVIQSFGMRRVMNLVQMNIMEANAILRCYVIVVAVENESKVLKL